MPLSFRSFVIYSAFALGSTLALHSIAFGRLFNDESDLGKVPAEIEANQLDYDTNSEIVTATGNVEVVQGTRKLNADGLSYDQKTDLD